MNDSRFTVDHVRLATDKPFEDVAQAFERQLGRFDPDVYKALAAGGDAEGASAKIEAMAGPSGFMLFATHNHGALLRLAGQKRKAVQYVVGRDRPRRQHIGPEAGGLGDDSDPVVRRMWQLGSARLSGVSHHAREKNASKGLDLPIDDIYTIRR